MTKKIIFLDFDGVLNSYRSARIVHSITGKNGYGVLSKDDPIIPENLKLDPTSVSLLRDIVDETGAEIVISSTWRMYFDLEHFVEMFKQYGWENAPVIGKTPVLHKKRGYEISQWLSKFGSDVEYVIIDDDSDMLSEQLNYFVHTEHEVGLSKNDKKRAVEILNKSQEKDGNSFFLCVNTRSGYSIKYFDKIPLDQIKKCDIIDLYKDQQVYRIKNRYLPSSNLDNFSIMDHIQSSDFE